MVAMKSKKQPTPKKAQQNAPAVPTPLQINTPDPREATRPVKLTQVVSASQVQTARAQAVSELEETRPIAIRAKSGTDLPAPEKSAPEGQTDALPAWLIAYAREAEPKEAPPSPAEETRQIHLHQPEAPANTDAAFAPVIPTSPEASGWTVETLPAAAPQEAGSVNMGEHSEPLAPSSEADDRALSTSEAELAESPSQPENTPELDSTKFSLARMLDGGKYAEADQLVADMSADPAARAEAMKVLRSRLDTSRESLPLWEFYARLCSADNQIELAQSARETAEKLKNLPGE